MAATATASGIRERSQSDAAAIRRQAEQDAADIRERATLEANEVRQAAYRREQEAAKASNRVETVVGRSSAALGQLASSLTAEVIATERGGHAADPRLVRLLNTASATLARAGYELVSLESAVAPAAGPIAGAAGVPAPTAVVPTATAPPLMPTPLPRLRKRLQPYRDPAGSAA